MYLTWFYNFTKYQKYTFLDKFKQIPTMKGKTRRALHSFSHRMLLRLISSTWCFTMISIIMYVYFVLGKDDFQIWIKIHRIIHFKFHIIGAKIHANWFGFTCIFRQLQSCLHSFWSYSVNNIHVHRSWVNREVTDNNLYVKPCSNTKVNFIHCSRSVFVV